MTSEKSKVLLQHHCNCHTQVSFNTYKPRQENKREKNKRKLAMPNHYQGKLAQWYITKISCKKV